jgi:hypothetical protein
MAYYYYLGPGLSDAMSLSLTKAEGEIPPSLQIKNSKGVEIWRSRNRESEIGKQDRKEKEDYDYDYYLEVGKFYLDRIKLNQEKGPYAWKEPVYQKPRFTLQNDGNAIIWFENDFVWAMNERFHGIGARTFDTLTPSQDLRPGECLMSMNMEYACVLQTDGNLIVSTNGREIWSTKTAGSKIRGVYLDADGNLIMRDSDGDVKWQTRGGYTEEAKLVLKNNGDLVTIVAGQTVWSRSQQPEGWKDPKILGTRWGYKAS